MRCGFATLGLITQTSGHNQGSLRNIDAMLHRVSPRFTVYDLGADGLKRLLFGAGAGAACSVWAGNPATAASVAVRSSGAAASPVAWAAGGGKGVLSASRGRQDEQPASTTS